MSRCGSVAIPTDAASPVSGWDSGPRMPLPVRAASRPAPTPRRSVFPVGRQHPPVTSGLCSPRSTCACAFTILCPVLQFGPPGLVFYNPQCACCPLVPLQRSRQPAFRGRAVAAEESAAPAVALCSVEPPPRAVLHTPACMRTRLYPTMDARAHTLRRQSCRTRSRPPGGTWPSVSHPHRPTRHGVPPDVTVAPGS